MDTKIDCWTHNLRLLYSLLHPARQIDGSLYISTDIRWVGMVAIPELLPFQARSHPQLRGAEIVSDWPVIVAFARDEDYLLAKLRFAR